MDSKEEENIQLRMDDVMNLTIFGVESEIGIVFKTLSYVYRVKKECKVPTKKKSIKNFRKAWNVVIIRLSIVMFFHIMEDRLIKNSHFSSHFIVSLFSRIKFHKFRFHFNKSRYISFSNHKLIPK